MDVTGLNEDSWFDRAGDFHSNKLHVVERYTPRSPDTMMYEATRSEDPLTFSRPWKISMPLYRHVGEGREIVGVQVRAVLRGIALRKISQEAGQWHEK